MILDLDKLKEAGEIPRDLDAKIQRIMGLPETCEGPLDPDDDYCNYACSVCGSGPTGAYGENEPELRKIEIQLESGPYPAWKWFREHPRVPLPYSTDLVASRKVLEWVLRRTGSFAFEAEEIWREVTVGDRILNSVSVDFYNLSDEPLAIAVAVNALFGESK